MSLLTLTELWSEVPDANSDRELFDLAAGLSQSIARLCNRAIAMRASEAASVDGVATIKVPRHSLSVGQSVSLYSVSDPENWSGVFEVTSVGCIDTFTVTLVDHEEPPEETITLEHQGELTVRPVIDAVLPTNGGSSIFLDPRPVAEVLSVELGQSDGTFADPLELEDFGLSEVKQGVSFTGELTLFSGSFPCRSSTPRSRGFLSGGLPAGGSFRNGYAMPRGARIRYVSGEPLVPSDLIYACRKLVSAIRKRAKRGDMKSMSYDYFSYTRMSGDELAGLVGEAESIIQSHRLAVM